jgi:hypothetical protein
MSLFAEQAANAPRGWSWGRKDARAFPGIRPGSGLYAKYSATGWEIALPLWAFALLCAILPGWVVLHHLPVGQRRVGLCPKCGYDLRATPDRCPECGAVPAALEQAAVQSLAEPK